MFIFIKKQASLERICRHMELCADNQTNELLALAKAGDGHAFESLLDAYSPLIESLVSGFSCAESEFDDRDDLRQEASIAFFNAVQKYDASHAGVQFGLYAKICIRNRLISYLRRMQQRPPLSSEDTPYALENDEDPAKMLVEREDYLALYSRINSLLSPYEKRVWWMYLSGRTAREIGNAVGKDERSVQNAIYRIRQKLRRALPTP